MQFPKRRMSDILKKRDDGPIYLTEQAIKDLYERHAHLKKMLPEYISEAQRTAAYGDRSDNAEYKEAKSILRRTHRQIFTIENQLKRAVVIKSGVNAKRTIQIGSSVLLELKGGTRKTFQILGPHETDPIKGIISYKSPLGAALIGRKEGDAVRIKIADGFKEYLIIRVS